MDQYIGRRLEGRYEISEIIGVGGMANVYKALDTLQNKIVAVKILRSEFLDNEEFVRRFKNESKAIAVLSHPNIVKIFDVSFTSEHQFIVMEFVDGITLKEYINLQGKVNWKEVVHFTTEILKALEHAHAKGIIHRDIKPHNIMLLSDGTIKVMDFGIARFARIETGINTNKAMGSVHYISPEQAKGDLTSVTTDIYSTGVMMFEMLTGELPFEAETAISVAIKQISDNPRRPREINPEIPEGLEDIVIRAMQKDPMRRYPNADAMLADISEFKNNPSIVFEYEYMSPERTRPYFSALEKKAAAIPDYEERRPVRRQTAEEEVRANKADSQGSGKMSTGKNGKLDSRSKQKAKKRKKQEDEYYEGEEKPKSALIPILIGAGIAFALLALAAVITIFVIIKPFSSTEEIEVPNIVGMKLTDVLNNSLYEDIVFEVSEETETEEYEAGQIFAQEPIGGKMMKKGGTVFIKVSKGKVAAGQMPDLVGLTKDQATSQLSKFGIVPKIITETSETMEGGRVIRTEPAKGSAITAATVVTVVINDKPESSGVQAIPDVSGLELERAKAKITETGHELGTVKEIASDKPLGVVISQDPAKDTPATAKTKINLEVSNGKGITLGYEMNITLPSFDEDVLVEVTVDGQTIFKQSMDTWYNDSIDVKFQITDGTTLDVTINGTPLKGFIFHIDANGKEEREILYDNSANF